MSNNYLVGQVGDAWPTDQETPPGYEWIRDRADKLGIDVLKEMLQSGKEQAFELRVLDGELLPVAVSDWRSPFCDGMLKDGFKSHYFSPKMPDDPAIPRAEYSYGTDWHKLFVRCSTAGADSASQQLPPKQLSVLEAITAIYGSVAGSKSTPVKVRDTAINNWLKVNGRAEVDSKTIQRALRTN